MRRYVKDHDNTDEIHIPDVYPQYSSVHVLVMEHIKGIPFTKLQEVKEHLDQNEDLIKHVVTKLLRILFIEGFFHADLHPGNLFLLDDGKVALIDFGACGHLSKEMRQSLMVMVYSLSEGHFHQLVHEFLEIAEYEGAPDARRLAHDLKSALSPYIGLKVHEMDIIKMIRMSLQIIAQYRIYLPLELTSLLRSLAMLDGMSKSLRVELDFFQVIQNNLFGFLQNYFSFEELTREGLWLGRDLAATIRILPQSMRRFLREWAQRNYAFEHVHRGLENELRRIQLGLVFLGSALLGSGLTIAAVILAIGSPDRLPDYTRWGVLGLFLLAGLIIAWGFSAARKL